MAFYAHFRFHIFLLFFWVGDERMASPMASNRLQFLREGKILGVEAEHNFVYELQWKLRTQYCQQKDQ